ncbi:MAG: DNA replication/repair protein RecF [Candidatus Thiodiazotropha sp. (ex Gloverina cf. vestifex)]|nr:DNA replication/repair protein RecF [Candidatus Thiodiazotropha sp. (ex Gloverina cf. vestifex)]
MIINKISINQLRNISAAELNFTQSINVIQGGNGAGKTSLLEAIYLLARARSFRSTQSKKLIQADKSNLTLFALTESQNGKETRIGLKKEGGKNFIKIDGKSVKKLSELAATLPIALITPQSHRLVEEGPEYRRRLLNWGVFHVEHRYRELLTIYNRVIAQRNASLKARNNDVDVWNHQINIYANEIKNLQAAYVASWNNAFKQLSKGVDFIDSINIGYQQGWDKGLSLNDALNKKIQIDQARGYTSVGPHRSDIRLIIDGIPVRNQLSRGQQKFLVTLLMLAQSKIQSTREKEKTVILFDDFQSELDRIAQDTLFDIIQGEACQTFMTIIEREKGLERKLGSDDEMFHVEHGSFSRAT